MSFEITQMDSLKLIIESDEKPTIIEIKPGELKELNKIECVRKPQFKGDREELSVIFECKIKQGLVEVKVTYSLDMSSHKVDSVDVVTIPDGVKVYKLPTFVTQDCDDDNLDLYY